ncbi:MAG: hypothetical protein ACREUT_19275 [Steroidobacteraceae bacterium]
MRFRLKAFGLHLSSSVGILSVILGALYLGWYDWPGWYLAGAARIVLIMILVDAALGPLMTLIIASPSKSARELARDIGVIVTVQLIGLAYGTLTLWHGRPLYYAFSVDRLQLVQASDISSKERALANKLNPRFSPAWYQRPRWVWAPLPDDPKERQKIVESSIFGGDDVIDMPRYFKPWKQCETQLRQHLRKIGILPFSRDEHAELARKAKALSLASDAPDALLFTGPGHSLVAIFDTRTLQIRAILAAD